MAVVAIGLVGGAFVVLNAANEGIQQELATLTAKESQLNQKLKVLEGQENQLKEVEDRTNKIATLFVGNFPTSAIANEIRSRTPITVLVNSITQKSPTVTDTTQSISLNGQVTNYNELNDFILLLKASPLLDAEKTKLVSSTLQQATIGANFTLVNFVVETAVTSKNPAELLPELQKRGAEGLVARVNLLKQQGVIK